MDTYRFQLIYASGQEFKQVRASNPCEAWREVGGLIAGQGRNGCTAPVQVVLARTVEPEEAE